MHPIQVYHQCKSVIENVAWFSLNNGLATGIQLKKFTVQRKSFTAVQNCTENPIDPKLGPRRFDTRDMINSGSLVDPSHSPYSHSVQVLGFFFSFFLLSLYFIDTINPKK